MEYRIHITKTPGICGGRACISGHRVRVQDVVVWHESREYCADEIVDMFPGITLAGVYSALAHYFDNQQEINDQFANDDRWAERGRIAPSLIAKEDRESVSG